MHNKLYRTCSNTFVNDMLIGSYELFQIIWKVFYNDERYVFYLEIKSCVISMAKQGKKYVLT